ncbi:MAG TPA: ATP-grasp domain-containing protein [Candidatus Saccharimonadia bacterium]|nr:ATP-grasp domain-containing protein [Candidatus Saccharimonadia bacterium]
MTNENAYLDEARDVIVSVRGVEPGLLTAAKKLEKRLGRPLRGIDLVDVRATENKYRIKDETGFFKEVICDFDNVTELQQALKPYADTVLVATCRLEEAIKDFRRLTPLLPYISTPSESSLVWCTQKALMRDRLHAHNPELVPRYINLGAYNPETLSHNVADFEFPVIVKPNGLYSSLLVSRCNDYAELQACLAKTFELIDEVYARGDGTGVPSVLVEEMIQGDMYSIDAYVDPYGKVYCLPAVQVITAHAIGLPGFYSYRHIIPTGLSEAELERAYEAARDSVKALNLRATSAHIELFHSPSGWKIIELGPRMGGYREDLYREAYGIDHHYNDLLVRIGLEPEIPSRVLKHAAGVNIYADEEGIITELSGIEEARQLPSLVTLGTNAKVGDIALFADSGGELIVDAILSNEDPEKLEADVARLRELVTITVEPRPEEVIENIA